MLPLMPFTFGPKAMFSKIDLGNGFGFWNTMPMRRRTSTASTSLRVQILAAIRRCDPSMWKLLTRSFMRFMQRSSVLLPQPDGPMSAVILRSGMRNETLSSARNWP